MRIKFLLLLTGILFGQSNFATITIYKNGTALVKQPVIWNITKGNDYLIYDDLPNAIQSETPFLDIHGVQVTSQQYFNKVFSGNDYLNSLIGEKISVKPKDERAVDGILLEYTTLDLTIKHKNSIYIYTRSDIEYIEGAEKIKNPILKPYLSWDVKAKQSGDVEGRILYKTSNMNWTTLYRLLLLDQEHGELIADAVISNNTNLDYEDAQLQVVEGQLNLSKGNGPVSVLRGNKMMAMDAYTQAATENKLGDYLLYPLNGTYDLQSKEKLSVRLYGPIKVKFHKTYIFENVERRQKEEPLAVNLSMENTDDYGLNIPLPVGKVEMYLNTQTHQMEYIGSDDMRQTPKGHSIKLSSGRAFNVTGKRKVINYDRQRKSEEAVIEIQVTNGREDSVSVKLIEHINGDWIVKQESDNYTKEDASTIHFPFVLGPSETKIVSYTYRKEWQ